MSALLSGELARRRGLESCSGRHLVRDLRAYLLGDWMITRLILNRRTGERGSLLGWAAFLSRDDGLAYDERGELRLGGYRGLVSRAYRYGFVTPGRARVRFIDGRPFHDLDLGTGEAEVLHLCGGDRYCGRFTVLGPDVWSCEWSITGPRKDAVVATRYLRAACDT